MSTSKYLSGTEQSSRNEESTQGNQKAKVFVFGANEAFLHGKGAALEAVKHWGAVYGKGGRQGQSYAIPTKGKRGSDGFAKIGLPLPLQKIQQYVDEFVAYASAHLDEEFMVTQIGCGIAGFSMEEIAPMFRHAPGNCSFDLAWEPILDGRKYWGTF